MTRIPVQVRPAEPGDAEALIAIWSELSQGLDKTGALPEPTVADVHSAVARLAVDPAEQLLVGVLDSHVVGVVHLRRAPVSPVHPQDAVHVSHLHVLSSHRRRGVGCALLGAAAAWAEEKDSPHVLGAVAAGSRDSNRFLARLGFAPVAVVRGTTAAALRKRLAAPPHRPHAQGRRVVMARRSVRGRAAGSAG